LLNVSEKTFYAMGQKGGFSALEESGQWRGIRADLDQWIEDQKAASRDGESK
jgi:hypothetical protein